MNADVDRARAARDVARQAWRDAEAVVAEAVVAAFAAVVDDEQARRCALRELYWSRQDIPVPVLQRAAGLRGVAAAAGPGPVVGRCVECGEEQRPTSRTDARRLAALRPLLCGGCERAMWEREWRRDEQLAALEDIPLPDDPPDPDPDDDADLAVYVPATRRGWR